jgi:hypothetical protein
MRRSSMWMLAVLGMLALVGRSGAADGPAGASPKQEGPSVGGPGGPPGGFHLIPRFAEAKLNLTDDQKKQVADLEKEVKDRLAKILTAEQLKTLEEARPPRRPGGPGSPGGDGPQPQHPQVPSK